MLYTLKTENYLFNRIFLMDSPTFQKDVINFDYTQISKFIISVIFIFFYKNCNQTRKLKNDEILNNGDLNHIIYKILFI